MGRKHRKARERETPKGLSEPSRRDVVEIEGRGYCLVTIPSSKAAKAYTCPFCNQSIPPGTRHVVLVPQDAPDERRHWHTGCANRYLAKRGASGHGRMS